jgi:hypothetical protein
MQFGEDVEGYDVPVLNEREIRAAAGLMFVAILVAVMLVILRQDFVFLKYVLVVFLADFMIRVVVSPHFSPVLIIGRMIVSAQVPEYTGAAQKKFAWKIGLGLSGLMFFLLIILNSYSVITGIGCLLCLVFLFLESAFGICLGCIVYGWLYKNETMLCAGDACNTKTKEAIQKTSRVQLVVVIGCIVFVVTTMIFFHHRFREQPKKLGEVINAWQVKAD